MSQPALKGGRMSQFLKSSLPEPPIDPPEAAYREIQDEQLIEIALAEADELISSLIYLDRRISPKTHFEGGYKALNDIKGTLKEMLGKE